MDPEQIEMTGRALPQIRLDDLRHVSSLSPNEVAILTDAANGLTMDESARKRSKSPYTVKTQRHAIIIKLGVRNIAHAVAFASRDNWLIANAS